MVASQARFLRTAFVPLLQTIPSHTPPAWGKMTLQQMVEHFADAVRIASGVHGEPILVSPAEQVPKLQDFIRSDKPFRENTRNPLLPETPPPVRNISLEKALAELQTELDHFFTLFAANEALTTRNPIFGDLDYDLNVQLLYKHAVHHLRQFGVEVKPIDL